ncbi:MAG: hypothetical protein ACE5E0_01280 [Terriglobia bacterium]
MEKTKPVGNLKLETERVLKLMGAYTVAALVPLAFLGLPLLVIIVGVCGSAAASLIAEAAARKRPDLTLGHPIFLGVNAAHTSVITFFVHHTGGWKASCFSSTRWLPCGSPAASEH